MYRRSEIFDALLNFLAEVLIVSQYLAEKCQYFMHCRSKRTMHCRAIGLLGKRISLDGKGRVIGVGCRIDGDAKEVTSYQDA
jgi:hypothetical protein